MVKTMYYMSVNTNFSTLIDNIFIPNCLFLWQLVLLGGAMGNGAINLTQFESTKIISTFKTTLKFIGAIYEVICTNNSSNN